MSIEELNLEATYYQDEKGREFIYFQFGDPVDYKEVVFKMKDVVKSFNKTKEWKNTKSNNSFSRSLLLPNQIRYTMRNLDALMYVVFMDLVNKKKVELKSIMAA